MKKINVLLFGVDNEGIDKMNFDEDFKVSNGIMGTYKGIKIKRLIPDQIYPFEVKGKYIVDEIVAAYS